jgi:Ca2+-binding EF-hand superfamily protein
MQDLSAMLAFFDKNGDGVIGYEEFIGALREPLSTRKNILVEKIWKKIAGDQDVIDLASINCPAFYS